MYINVYFRVKESCPLNDVAYNPVLSVVVK